MTVGRSLRRLLRAGMGAVLPSSRFLVRGPRSAKAVCLTFDDGPHPDHTPALLDVLGRAGVRATFFVIGQRAAAHPEFVRRMVAEGHAVGHHTYSHSDPRETPAARLAVEIEQTGDVLTRAVGTSSTLFRPPHGQLTPAKLWRLWRLGMTVALWNVDPRDFACGSADELADRLRRHEPQGGDVILFHDDRPFAYAALPEFIARVRTAGLTFATLPDWVGRPATPATTSLERSIP
jgi:peptidoglycan-N-acetylglucosamine deacetylase